MSAMCRTILKTIGSCTYQHYNGSLLNASKKNIVCPVVAYSSDKCGSDKKGSGQDGSESKGSDPCVPCEPWCCNPCPPCDDNPASPTMYDRRKYGHSLPTNNVNVCFDPLPQIPTGIFRNTDCEERADPDSLVILSCDDDKPGHIFKCYNYLKRLFVDCIKVLGLGAGKCCFYKNPEYFSYHHMSYYDMHMIMRCYRKPSPNTNRKP